MDEVKRKRYKGTIQDGDCSFIDGKRRLPVALVSTEGSGNTWVCGLLEKARTKNRGGLGTRLCLGMRPSFTDFAHSDYYCLKNQVASTMLSNHSDVSKLLSVSKLAVALTKVFTFIVSF